MARKRQGLRIKGGLWTKRGDWTPVYVLEQQRQAGIEYQSYGLGPNREVVHAGVTRHPYMNQSIAKQIHRVWTRWRIEYRTFVNTTLPPGVPVHFLIVFPVDQPDRAETYYVGP